MSFLKWLPNWSCDNHVSLTARTYVSNDNFTPKEEQLCQGILKSLHIYRSNGSDNLSLNRFIVWPSGVTLIFNLPEQVFQMALRLPKENNCAKLFWNLFLN